MEARWYGSGTASFDFPLDVYAIGDAIQIPRAPKYPCRVVVSYPEFRFRPDLELWIDNPTLAAIGHGCSSGGMATGLACFDFDVVGVTGFDGYNELGKSIGDEMMDRHRIMLERWIAKGKRLVSLMPVSMFNDILEPAEDFLRSVH